MSKLRMDREHPIAQTVRPIRAALVAGTGFPVCPNCEGGSPFPGEDSAAAAAGTFAVSTAGDKKGRHLRFPTLNFEAFSISAILRILKLINASKTHFSINNSKSYYKMRKILFFWFVQFHTVLEVYEPQTLV